MALLSSDIVVHCVGGGRGDWRCSDPCVACCLLIVVRAGRI